MRAKPIHAGVLAAALVAVILSAVVGWSFGGGSSGAGEEAGRASKSQRASSRSARGERRGPPASVRRELERIRLAGSPAEQMRRAIELARTIPLEEFEEWIRKGWFDYRDGFALTLFHKVGMERWQLEDPLGYLAWCRKEQNGEGVEVLARWVEGDAGRLESYFKEHPNPTFELEVLGAMAGKHPALALAQLMELVESGGLTDQSDDRLRVALAKIAGSAPAQLEQALDSLPSELRDVAEGVLVTERLKASPDETLRSLMERPDGWRLLRSNIAGIEGLGDRILANLADLPDAWRQSLASDARYFLFWSDPRGWYAADFQGLGFTEEQASSLRDAALGVMAAKHPAEALALLAESEMSQSSRRYLINNAFNRVRHDETKRAELMALLETDQDREQARGIVAVWIEAESLREELKTPEGWLSVAERGGESNEVYNLVSALQNWNADQITELRARIATLPEEERSQVAAVLLDRSRYMDDPTTAPLVGEAFRYLLEKPVEAEENGASARDVLRGASTHAVNLVIQNPAEAREWVESLPAGEARLWAAKNMAATWAQYDPVAAANWVQSLPVEERSEVQGFLEHPGR